MEDTLTKIRQIEEYAAAVGATPESICRKATKNPRLWGRLNRRVSLVEDDVSRILDFIAANPAPTSKRVQS